MKRSNGIKLLLLGTTALMLVACEEDQKVYGSYSSIQECAIEHGLTQCEEEYKRASEAHKRTAPNYASREQCEAVHGSCGGGGQNASSPWLPLMVGYMMGSNSGSGMPLYYGNRERDDRRSVYAGSTYLGNAPVPAGGNGVAPLNTAAMSNGNKFAFTDTQASGIKNASPSAAKTAAVSPSSAPRASAAAVSARGGFGGSGVSAGS